MNITYLIIFIIINNYLFANTQYKKNIKSKLLSKKYVFHRNQLSKLKYFPGIKHELKIKNNLLNNKYLITKLKIGIGNNLQLEFCFNKHLKKTITNNILLKKKSTKIAIKFGIWNFFLKEKYCGQDLKIQLPFNKLFTKKQSGKNFFKKKISSNKIKILLYTIYYQNKKMFFCILNENIVFLKIKKNKIIYKNINFPIFIGYKLNNKILISTSFKLKNINSFIKSKKKISCLKTLKNLKIQTGLKIIFLKGIYLNINSSYSLYCLKNKKINTFSIKFGIGLIKSV
jgi:hypothetical protein